MPWSEAGPDSEVVWGLWCLLAISNDRRESVLTNWKPSVALRLGLKPCTVSIAQSCFIAEDADDYTCISS